MDLSTQLGELLRAAERPGQFCHQGRLVSPMPHLEVRGVGQISFPLREEQAQALLGVASPAPYGRGPDTLLDPDVRRCHQIEPAQLTAPLGAPWADNERLLARLAGEGLGVFEEGLRIELYKVLLYQPGDFFLPHRDTEKEDGMFATLVVSLPSPHRGGQLRVEHLGETDVIDLSGGAIWEVLYGAFYSDCKHELLPVTEGYRLCLVYNLVRDGGPCLNAPDYTDEVRQLSAVLGGWDGDEGTPNKIVYLLEHRYTAAELGFDRLKNGDAAAADILKRAAKSSGCTAFLGTVSITETGSAEPVQYRGYGRYSDDEEFEVIDVHEHRRDIERWLAPDGQEIALGRMSFGEEELSPPGALDDEPPDEQSFAEASGNAGATYERAYRRAALIVWPTSRLAEVLCTDGPAAATPYIDRLAQEDVDEAAVLASQVIEAFAQIQGRVFGFSGVSETARFLDVVHSLEHSAVLRDALQRLLPHPDFCVGDASILARIWQQQGWEGAQQAAVGLATRHGRERLGACAALAGAASSRGAPDELAASILDAMLSQEPGDPTWVSASYRRSRVSVDDVCLLIKALAWCPASLVEWLALFERFAVVYSVDAVLIPGLLLTAEQLSGSLLAARAVQAVGARCVAHLKERISEELAPPKDWVRAAPFHPRGDPDLQELKEFLCSAEQRELHMAIRKDRRRVIHSLVESRKIDATTKTIRRGSPHTLVVTKNQASYEARVEQRENDLLLLGRLREFLQ